MISDIHVHKDIVIYNIYIYILLHTHVQRIQSIISLYQASPSHSSPYIRTFIDIQFYIYIYICNYILKFSPSIRYHATLYTHCVYIYIPSDLPDLPNRHSPKQYVPHLYPLLNTISPHYYIHYSPFLLVKSSEFPLKLAISVVLLWKKPIETSSPFFGWLKPC